MRRLCSLLLCIVLIITLIPFAATAAGSNGITNPPDAQDGTEELNLTKKLTPASNGKYDITMESWATGQVNSYEEKIPTDFVVVVDQSGSMSETDMPTGTPAVADAEYLETVAEGSYYYYDATTGNYYRVYGVKDYLMEYHAANTLWTEDVVKASNKGLRWFQSEQERDFDVENQYYYRDNSGIYRPIKVTIAGEALRYELKFSYVDANGDTVFFHYPDKPYYKPFITAGWANINDPYTDGQTMYPAANAAVKAVFSSDDTAYTFASAFSWLKAGMYIDKDMYTRHPGYTKLCYRDINGVEHTLNSNQNNGQSVWEYCQKSGDNVQAITTKDGSTRPTYSGLYTFPSTGRRIDALQSALTKFSKKIANEKDSFGAVDNKISIVGFSSGESTYKNTELLTGSTFDIVQGGQITNNPGYAYSADGYNHNGKMKSEATAADYAGALVPAANDDGTVNNKITNGINALTAYGGTQPEDGLAMANQILQNRSKTKYTIRSGEHKGEETDRNTIVIFFTDGRPGDYTESNQYSEANEVVQTAKSIKDCGATIFSIGVFGESDANPLTYSSETTTSSDTAADWKYLGGWVETYKDGSTYYCLRRQWRPNNAEGYTETANDTIYDYMSVVSSNYPDAKNYIAPAWLTSGFNGNYIAATDGDTVRQKSSAETTNKYYRMASSQQTLIDAFLQAATMNNSESQSGVALDSTAIFKDAVNLEDFDITGATYTVKWQPVKITTEGAKPTDNGTAETKVNGAAVPSDGNIEYTGFDYSANYVTTEKNGYKLVVTINGIKPKRMSSELKSNAGNAGVYGAGSEEATVEIASPTLDNTNDENAVFYVVERKITSDGEYDTRGPVSYSVKDFYNATKKRASVDLLGKDNENNPFVTGGYLYGGHYNSNYSVPSEVSGTDLEPKFGETIYIKSVDDQYLVAKNLYTTYYGEVVSCYAVATVDDRNYKTVGFYFNDGKEHDLSTADGKLYTSASIKNANADKIYAPDYFLASKKGTETARIAAVRLGGKVNGTLQAYWITPDDVLVKGDTVRTLVNGRKDGDDQTGKTVKGDAGTSITYEGKMPEQSMFVCNDEDEPISADTGVKLAGYTTSLNGNIALNFYLELSDEAAADKDAIMKFTLPGANHTAEEVKLADAKTQKMDGKTYYVFSAGVAAKDMTSPIKAQFVKSDGTKSEEWTYTIKQYCDYIRNNPDKYDAESVALVENMLNYGGNAQIYAGYRTDDLANADVDLALPEVVLDASFNPVQSGSCEGLTYKGSSAMLTTTTGIRHYFAFAGSAEDYTFAANGEELNVETDKSGNSYVLIDNIKAKDLRKPFKLTVTDAEGNQFTLSYSVYTNIKQVVEGEYPDATKNLMRSMYGYGEAAKAYFASRG